MPAGKTHDRITLWSLPLVAGAAFSLTWNDRLTLIVSGGFLFSGLMFGPDLDINSRQYQRWGWLRWIWLPYQRSLGHRSCLSHGPVIGTLLRILYLLFWVFILGGFIVLSCAIARHIQGTEPWPAFMQRMLAILVHAIQRSLHQYPAELIALLLGLELGAMSHACSDWLGSAYGRMSRWVRPRRGSKRCGQKQRPKR